MRNNPEVRQQMFELIEQWKQSGLSQNAFCERHSIRFPKFYYWYKCYRRVNDISDENNLGFVKLKIEKPTVARSVEIHFPGGVRVLFHEPPSFRASLFKLMSVRKHNPILQIKKFIGFGR